MFVSACFWLFVLPPFVFVCLPCVSSTTSGTRAVGAVGRSVGPFGCSFFFFSAERLGYMGTLSYDGRARLFQVSVSDALRLCCGCLSIVQGPFFLRPRSVEQNSVSRLPWRQRAVRIVSFRYGPRLSCHHTCSAPETEEGRACGVGRDPVNHTHIRYYTGRCEWDQTTHNQKISRPFAGVQSAAVDNCYDCYVRLSPCGKVL